MTVRIEKPAVNVREKLAELDKPTGIAGEAMLRAETPQEQFNLINAGRKNLIINGNFDVWQRGTSSSGTTSSGYQSADRWFFNASGATYTTAQQTFTLGQTEVPYNPKYFLRFTVTGANDNAGVWQKIEDVRKSSGQTVTLSFWAKYNSDSPSSTINLKFIQNFGTGGSPSSQVTVIETIRLYDVWTKYEVQHTFTSLSGKTLGSDNNSWFGLEISNGTNETWDMDLAQVQLEVGKVATPFEHRSYGEELALCQRYYYRITSDGTNQNIFGVGLVDGSADAYTQIYFPVTMRTAPTAMDITGTASDYGVRMGSGTSVVSDTVPLLSSDTQPDIGIVLFSVATGLTANSACFGRAVTSGTYLGFYAEL